MTITIGSSFVSTFWLVSGATLAGLLLGARLAFRYGRTTLVPGSWQPARVSGIVIVSGALGWGGGMLLSHALGEPAPTLPQAVYMTPEGKPLRINEVAEAEASEGIQRARQTSQSSGVTPVSTHVTVVNLWASWCGPCRREMPAFTHAQALHPDVRFIFANQGETAETVTAFLKQENLRLNNVVLDPDRSWMTRFHSSGIPTTLFFDANGRLLSSRVGEMSEAALDAHITQLRQTH